NARSSRGSWTGCSTASPWSRSPPNATSRTPGTPHRRPRRRSVTRWTSRTRPGGFHVLAEVAGLAAQDLADAVGEVGVGARADLREQPVDQRDVVGVVAARGETGGVLPRGDRHVPDLPPGRGGDLADRVAERHQARPRQLVGPTGVAVV